MSDGLLDDIADPRVDVEAEALDNLTRCRCGRPRTLTNDDLLVCPACDLPPGSGLAALRPRPTAPADAWAVPIPA